MKGALFAAAIVVLAARIHGHRLLQCCEEGLVMPRGMCSNGNKTVDLGCKSHFMLEEITVTEDGDMTSADTPGYVWGGNESTFCVGEMNVTKPYGHGIINVSIVCFEQAEEPSWNHIQIYGVLTLISSVFLVLTLSVYMFLPRLRDLQGKCIMCQCGCLAIAYLNLGLIQLQSPTTTIDNCTSHSFLLYFWMMAMMFWLNVVTINLYRSVTQASYLQKTETRQFLYYSAYAWGAASVFLVAALVANYVDGSHLKPGFGKSYTCWFKGVDETWAFFYGPMGIIITANTVIFTLTSLQLWKTSKSYEVGSTLTTLKYKFVLYLKLFIVTGVTWVFEVASFAHGTAHIFWTITDVFNCLQGFTFFLLLVVFRRRALAGLAERGLDCGLVRCLLRLFRHDREGDNIVGSEAEADCDHPADSESPFYQPQLSTATATATQDLSTPLTQEERYPNTFNDQRLSVN